MIHMLLVIYAVILSCQAINNIKIIDGQNATEGEFPYMVSIRTDFNEHDCGGSIIGDKWILTAGHCTDLTRIQFGTIELNNFNYIPENTRIIKRTIRHPDYNVTVYNNSWAVLENDLAILELDQPLPFGQNVQPIKLPQEDDLPPDNQQAVFTGWGFTTRFGDIPPSLLKVNLTVFDEEYCQENSVNLYHNGSNICAGAQKDNRGVCYEDSGGPLVIDGIQWGILSWMVPPCGNTISGYSLTSFYRNWIKNVTGI